MRTQEDYFSDRAFAGSDSTDRLCKELEAEGTEEARARIENIDELINKAASYEEDAQEPSLEGFSFGSGTGCRYRQVWMTMPEE